MIDALVMTAAEGWGLFHLLRADPGTLTLALISSVVSAGGAVVSGIQQKNAADASAQANEQNAAVAASLGAQREAAARNEGRRLQGKQIAAGGANGVTLSGSLLDYTLDTAVETELAALNERFQATTESNAYKTQANQDRAAGKAALYGGFISGASELAGGMAKFKSAPSSSPTVSSGWFRR